MISLTNSILVLVLLMNLFALGTSRLSTVIRIVAFQGILLAILPILLHGEFTIAVLVTSAGAVAIKAIAIPAVLQRAMRTVQIKREVEPMIGFMPSMILGAVATVFALLFARVLPLAPEHGSTLVVPASIGTVLVGFIFLTTRFKAISQVIGYLMLDNGIFIFGTLLTEAMPLLVEMGVLLDLLVGIFVAGIIVNHIQRAFSSQDTRALANLRD